MGKLSHRGVELTFPRDHIICGKAKVQTSQVGLRFQRSNPHPLPHLLAYHRPEVGTGRERGRRGRLVASPAVLDSQFFSAWEIQAHTLQSPLCPESTHSTLRPRFLLRWYGEVPGGCLGCPGIRIALVRGKSWCPLPTTILIHPLPPAFQRHPLPLGPRFPCKARGVH